ncbi:MAG TPA: hypothetical protein VKB88_23385 [Bryobacteraceae bacterium]|nr:hypothetical protein [Bryobacteraceae bacterium]
MVVPLREPPNNIYNFGAIDIDSGYTVTFQRNLANTPAILLATGNVTINGTVDVSGGNGTAPTNPAVPGVPGLGGPGGFNGAAGPVQGAPDQIDFTAGLGPGAGGLPGSGSAQASFAAGSTSLDYGIPQLQPLIGGSGGGSFLNTNISAPGAGGGGALLIAASGTIDLGPVATAACAIIANSPGTGSGGAIRLVATNLTGGRCLSATNASQSITAAGRIRLESAQASQYTGTTTPTASTNNPLFDPPITLFPPVTPTLQIVSIGGVTPPASPTANASTPDVILPGSTVNVVLQATHVPSGTAVQILVAPQFGGGPSQIVSGTLTGTVGQPKTATISVTLPPTGEGNISAVIRTPFVPEP